VGGPIWQGLRVRVRAAGAGLRRCSRWRRRCVCQRWHRGRVVSAGQACVVLAVGAWALLLLAGLRAGSLTPAFESAVFGRAGVGGPAPSVISHGDTPPLNYTVSEDAPRCSLPPAGRRSSARRAACETSRLSWPCCFCRPGSCQHSRSSLRSSWRTLALAGPGKRQTGSERHSRTFHRGLTPSHSPHHFS
jgi:hypothetical protein